MRGYTFEQTARIRATVQAEHLAGAAAIFADLLRDVTLDATGGFAIIAELEGFESVPDDEAVGEFHPLPL